jgi:hypothetical protein
MAPESRVGVKYRFDGEMGTLTLPELTIARPKALSEAAGELVRLIADGKCVHRCDAAFGFEVVRVLAAAEVSIERRCAVALAAGAWGAARRCEGIRAERYVGRALAV